MSTRKRKESAKVIAERERLKEMEESRVERPDFGCPVEGCNSSGHINSRYNRHRTMNNCPIARKRKLGGDSQDSTTLAKLPKLELDIDVNETDISEQSMTQTNPHAENNIMTEDKDEKDLDTVLLKEKSDIPCTIINVKEEPVSAGDCFQQAEYVQISLSGTTESVEAVTPTSGPIRNFTTVGVVVKKEAMYEEMTPVSTSCENITLPGDALKSDDLGSEVSDEDILTKIERECARVQGDGMDIVNISNVDVSLTPDDIQRQIQGIIQSQKETSSRLRDEILKKAELVRSQKPLNTLPASSSETVSSKIFKTKMSRSLSNSSLENNNVVKQELQDEDSNDEDSEAGDGEYMVLAEWTDGKVEEAGTSAADKENEKEVDEKDQCIIKFSDSFVDSYDDGSERYDVDKCSVNQAHTEQHRENEWLQELQEEINEAIRGLKSKLAETVDELPEKKKENKEEEKHEYAPFPVDHEEPQKNFLAHSRRLLATALQSGSGHCQRSSQSVCQSAKGQGRNVRPASVGTQQKGCAPFCIGQEAPPKNVPASSRSLITVVLQPPAGSGQGQSSPQPEPQSAQCQGQNVPQVGPASVGTQQKGYTPLPVGQGIPPKTFPATSHSLIGTVLQPPADSGLGQRSPQPAPQSAQGQGRNVETVSVGTQHEEKGVDYDKMNKSCRRTVCLAIPSIYWKKPERFCIYCHQTVGGGKLKRHITRNHKHIKEVKEALKKPHQLLNSFIEQKRKEGMYEYNQIALKETQFDPNVLMRKRKSNNKGLKMCTGCNLFVPGRTFHRHKRRCSSKNPEPMSLDLIRTSGLPVHKDSEFGHVSPPKPFLTPSHSLIATLQPSTGRDQGQKSPQPAPQLTQDQSQIVGLASVGTQEKGNAPLSVDQEASPKNVPAPSGSLIATALQPPVDSGQGQRSPEPAHGQGQKGSSVGHASVYTQQEALDENQQHQRHLRKKPERYCIYCHKTVIGGKLKRHITGKHQNIEEVKQALQKPYQLLNIFIEQKRKEGMYEYNQIALQKTQFDLNVLMRQRKSKSNDCLKMCTGCHLFLSNRTFYRHKHRCSSMNPEPMSLTLTRTSSLPAHKDSEFVKNILNKFRDNEAGKLCKDDSIIQLIGYQQFCTKTFGKSDFSKIKKEVMTEMRELARLYLRFKTIVVEDVTVEDMFDRKYLTSLREAINSLSAADENQNEEKHGLKLFLHSLVQRTIKYLKGFYAENMDDEPYEELCKFQTAYNFRIQELLSAAMCKSKALDKTRTPENLPEEKDLKTLKSYIEMEVQGLMNGFDISQYAWLRSLVMCRLTLYNCRRGDEPSRILTSEWTDAINKVCPPTEQVENIQDEGEKFLVGNFLIAYLHGQGQKYVPVLIPNNMVEALNVLVKYREQSGIHKDNLCLFGTKSVSAHCSSWNAAKDVFKKADVKIKSTKNRQRISTIYASLDMSRQHQREFLRKIVLDEHVNKDNQVAQGNGDVTIVGEMLSNVDNGTSISKEVLAAEGSHVGEEDTEQVDVEQEAVEQEDSSKLDSQGVARRKRTRSRKALEQEETSSQCVATRKKSWSGKVLEKEEKGSFRWLQEETELVLKEFKDWIDKPVGNPLPNSKCPTPGCDGEGHVTGLYTHHRSLSGCPMRSMAPPEIISVHESNLKCPTPGCSGRGHINSNRSMHRSVSGCPIAAMGKLVGGNEGKKGKNGYHLVILPKHDDPSKAILAACTEKQLIKLAAKQLGLGNNLASSNLPFAQSTSTDSSEKNKASDRVLRPMILTKQLDLLSSTSSVSATTPRTNLVKELEKYNRQSSDMASLADKRAKSVVTAESSSPSGVTPEQSPPIQSVSHVARPVVKERPNILSKRPRFRPHQRSSSTDSISSTSSTSSLVSNFSSPSSVTPDESNDFEMRLTTGPNVQISAAAVLTIPNPSLVASKNLANKPPCSAPSSITLSSSTSVTQGNTHTLVSSTTENTFNPGDIGVGQRPSLQAPPVQDPTKLPVMLPVSSDKAFPMSPDDIVVPAGNGHYSSPPSSPQPYPASPEPVSPSAEHAMLVAATEPYPGSPEPYLTSSQPYPSSPHSPHPPSFDGKQQDQRELLSCPTPGCDGSGHISGNYTSHRSLSGCPLADRATVQANQVEQKCPTPGCDGSGHVTGNYSSHRSLSGCPRAAKLKKILGKEGDRRDDEPLRCPIPGCDGSGHITGKYLSHRSASGCPLANRHKLQRQLISSLDGNIDITSALKMETFVCPTPSCDGSGHSNGSFLSHRSLSGCPRASHAMKKAKLSPVEMAALQKKVENGEDLNEDKELELLDSDVKDLKKTNMMEESQVIKMKAEMACLESMAQQNEHELGLIEAQNRQLQEYLQTVRCKIIANLNCVRFPSLEDVFREENFDSCLSMIHNLYATRNGDNYLQSTIKMAVADIPVA